ncbi:MAG: hypothetical protein M1830_008136 [Pleopsidium flavum]|nr:MAG: hypothetical protein M1830_008136 [Pleopsidium flavum]
MELARQEYPALLTSLQPAQAVTALNDRVRLIGKINSDIADWLQERRRIEELYVQGLRKLAGRKQQDGASELGIFQTPWQSIVSSTESLAASHHMLAQKIEADVERPLRDFSTKSREMQSISTVQGNLAAMARETEVAQKKADKLRDKGGKASAGKVANATSDVESASQQWDSQAPFIFERLQALDESRLNHLRDVLTQFQTHEVDQVERNRLTAESCLNVLLNVETADEINAFAVRTAGGRPGIAPRQKSKSTTGGTLSPPPSTGLVDDGASERSGTSGGAGRPGSGQEQRHGGLGGLKRLGTVIGRRRQSTKTSTQSSGRATSPEKRTLGAFSSPFRRGDSTRDMATIPSPDASMQNLQSSLPREEPSYPRAVEVPLSPRDGRRSDEQPNGNSIERGSGLISREGPRNGIQGLADPAQLQGDQPIQPPRSSAVEQRDAEGYTVPPSATDEISRAEQEAAANENDAPQFRLDIRNEPIQEEDSDAQTALHNVANNLRVAQQTVPNRKTGPTRGRRDVRNTIFIPTPQIAESPTGDSSIPQPASPFRAGRTATLSSEDHAASDTQSIRSSHSLSSMGGAMVKHPEMHQPGLNASIVETVSAWFQHGQVTKAIVIGELALAYNYTNPSSLPSTESIRLENFPVLEKVAPNSAFITQAPQKSGEYVVNLSNINRAAVAFKYQVHLEEATLPSHAPMVLTPSWKIEPTQASVMLSYAFNTAFASPAKRNVSMKNVTIAITLEGARASSCQSKPVGTFSKEKSLIYWKLGDITLDQWASGPHKLLARFVTESEAKPGNVEARWEIVSEHAASLGSGLSISHLDNSSEVRREEGADPFADEGPASTPRMTWKEVPIIRKLNSGKYVAV